MIHTSPNKPDRGTPNEGSSTPISTSSLFSKSLLDALTETYSGLRVVTLNWATTTAQDLEEVCSVLGAHALAGSSLERENLGLVAVSSERIAKLFSALHVVSQLIQASGQPHTSSEDYIQNVRDPLGHLKVLAADRLISSCGAAFSISGSSTRDISLRTLLMTHGEEIDRLIHAKR